MFDFMTPIVFAISAVVHMISLVVLVMNHYQQKAHNANILAADNEIARLEDCLESQREAAREMYLKVSDENDVLKSQCEYIAEDWLAEFQSNEALEVSLGQAMAYATDLETVIEAALDTIMEQRETIDVLSVVVAGGDPYEDVLEDQVVTEEERVDFYVAPEGTAIRGDAFTFNGEVVIGGDTYYFDENGYGHKASKPISVGPHGLTYGDPNTLPSAFLF